MQKPFLILLLSLMITSLNATIIEIAHSWDFEDLIKAKDAGRIVINDEYSRAVLITVGPIAFMKMYSKEDFGVRQKKDHLDVLTKLGKTIIKATIDKAERSKYYQ